MFIYLSIHRIRNKHLSYLILSYHPICSQESALMSAWLKRKLSPEKKAENMNTMKLSRDDHIALS